MFLYVRPLRFGLLRGSKLTPRAGGLVEEDDVLPFPRHELCCRCATACALLMSWVLVVSFAPSSDTGSEGNFRAGTAPFTPNTYHAARKTGAFKAGFARAHGGAPASALPSDCIAAFRAGPAHVARQVITTFGTPSRALRR